MNYNRGFFFLIFLNHSKVISSSLIRSCFCQDTKISHCTFFVQCQKLACKSISRTSPIVLYFILLSKFLSNLSPPLFIKFMQSFFYYPSCLGASTFVVRNCSVITSRIGGGLVLAFFVMLRYGKQGGEWYFMKGCNVTVKKIIKPFLCYCEEIGISSR